MVSYNKAILVGQIISPHGINGLIKIRSYTQIIQDIFKYKLFFEDKKLLTLEYLFTKSPNLICKINEINNRNEVEKLIGLKIFTDRDFLPETQDEEEFYITDLTNLPVLDQNANLIGKIINILNYGAGDLVEVEFINKKSEILKFTKNNFPVVNKEHVILDFSYRDE
jgi:16S rRNA processing protein RimM